VIYWNIGCLENTYCIINYRHVRGGLTSLNNSSGDFEDESKAVRDQMQIRFISVKPVRGRMVESLVQPLNVNTAGTASTSAPRRVVIAWLYQPLLVSYSSLSPKYICTLRKCSLHFDLLTDAEILENCSYSTEIKLEFVFTVTLSQR